MCTPALSRRAFAGSDFRREVAHVGTVTGWDATKARELAAELRTLTQAIGHSVTVWAPTGQHTHRIGGVDWHACTAVVDGRQLEPAQVHEVFAGALSID